MQSGFWKLILPAVIYGDEQIARAHECEHLPRKKVIKAHAAHKSTRTQFNCKLNPLAFFQINRFSSANSFNTFNTCALLLLLIFAYSLFKKKYWDQLNN